MTTKSKLPSGMIQRGETYHCQFRSRGRLVRKKLDNNLTRAKILLTEYRHRANQGDLSFLDDHRDDLTELREDYLADCELRLSERTVEIYRRSLGRVLGMIAPRRVDQLTVKAITQYRVRRMAQKQPGRRQPTGPATANLEVGILKGMLNWGTRHGYLDHSPIANVRDLPNHQPRKDRRALTVDEVERLLAVCDAPERAAFLVFLHTGMRCEELCGLTPDCVDLDNHVITITVAAAKSNKRREIPIARAIFDVLRDGVERAVERAGGVVLLNRAGRPWSQEGLIRRLYVRGGQASIEGCHRGGTVDTHSLRGTWATHAIATGADPKSVQEILGHSTLELTLNLYAKATKGGKISAVEGVSYGKTPAPSGEVETVKFSRHRTA